MLQWWQNPSLTLLHQQDGHPDQHSPVQRILHVYRSAVGLVWCRLRKNSLWLSENPEKCFSSSPRSYCLTVQHPPTQRSTKSLLQLWGSGAGGKLATRKKTTSALLVFFSPNTRWCSCIPAVREQSRHLIWRKKSTNFLSWPYCIVSSMKPLSAATWGGTAVRSPSKFTDEKQLVYSLSCAILIWNTRYKSKREQFLWYLHRFHSP